MNIIFRSGTPDDAEAITKLERSTFSDAWSIEEITDFLQPDPDSGRITIVAISQQDENVGEDGDHNFSDLGIGVTSVSRQGQKNYDPHPLVLGFIMVRKVLDEAQIYNFVVAPEYRSQGIGGELLDSVLDRLRRLGTARVFLEVRESNTTARAMYDARGFREVFRRPGYYRRPSEDGLIFELIFAAK